MKKSLITVGMFCFEIFLQFFSFILLGPSFGVSRDGIGGEDITTKPTKAPEMNPKCSKYYKNKKYEGKFSLEIFNSSFDEESSHFIIQQNKKIAALA